MSARGSISCLVIISGKTLAIMKVLCIVDHMGKDAPKLNDICTVIDVYTGTDCNGHKRTGYRFAEFPLPDLVYYDASGFREIEPLDVDALLADVLEKEPVFEHGDTFVPPSHFNCRCR